LAALEPPPPEVQALFAAMAGHKAVMGAFVSVTCGTMSLAEFFEPSHLGRVLAGADV
jgi:hypothetical protein